MREPNSSSERIGIFGGSFDPVHMGHLTIAQDAVEQLELNRLVFIPAAIPPHKQDCLLSDGHHRLNMLQLAIEDNLSFEVSDLELTRGGVSYTIDTLHQIQAEHPGAELFFIIGLDSLGELHLWHRIEDILSTCTVVPLGRGGENPDTVIRKSELPEPWKKKLRERLICIHEIGISSSEIRMRAAEGLSLHYLVPPAVEMYIAEHHLYQ
jgi:nicotinate-nucleotide adenylyltransferase